MISLKKIKNLNHGRETYAVYYGNDFVLKRPLPNFGSAAMDAWLEKQHRTQQVIEEIRAVNNPVYNVPQMRFINDEEYQILEERAPGFPLTREFYRKLSRRQQFEIKNSIANFLVDMNELKPVQSPMKHKICDELKFERLNNFIDSKMPSFFNINEVRQMARIRDNIATFEYTTRAAWSHGDLNSGNVLYDPKTSKLSFIDFAEAQYQYLYRDIFAPLQIELEIYKPVYEMYIRMHNKRLYSMPSPKNIKLREIMKYRIMVVWLKRFIKAADDLRMTSTNVKSIRNNQEKVMFMREQVQHFIDLERAFSK